MRYLALALLLAVAVVTCVSRPLPLRDAGGDAPAGGDGGAGVASEGGTTGAGGSGAGGRSGSHPLCTFAPTKAVECGGGVKLDGFLCFACVEPLVQAMPCVFPIPAEGGSYRYICVSDCARDCP